MALSLYRRHHGQCEGKHPKDSHSGELDERSKKWTRCACPIIAAGSMGKHFKRRKTGRIFWEDAKAVANRWEAAGRWPGSEAPAPEPEPDPSKDRSRMTVACAIESYLAYHKKNSALNTWLRYQGILRRITAYTDFKGYTYLEQWEKGDVVQCRDMWTVAQKTANADMSVVRAFFEFGVDRGWIEANPALRVKNFKSRDSASTRNEQKLPFSDAELARMYEACERYAPEYKARMKVTGRDLSDFISVSVYTGLRISDTSTFRSSRMNAEGEVVVRTTKRGVKVSTWLPVWLQQIIRRRSLEVGDVIFGERVNTSRNVIANAWRNKLIELWKLCGPWENKPTPHRFRHTFARVLLERKGVTVKDVAELMGDTEDVIRKYYSAWIPGRQEKLTATLKEAFAETPRPAADNVIEIKLAK